jgi:hypothetical protein
LAYLAKAANGPAATGSNVKEIPMRSFRLPVLLLALLALPAVGAGRSTLNPAAPKETAQFRFLVGNWDCKTRFMKADGKSYAEGTARWNGYYILDGWAIQDDWISAQPDGTEGHGTNIRSFNPKTGKWDNRWLPAGSLQWKYYQSEQVGDTMVMTGGEGKDARGEYVDRNTFYDIAQDSWSWRKDRSYDGGKSWVEGIGYIHATRVKK